MSKQRKERRSPRHAENVAKDFIETVSAKVDKRKNKSENFDKNEISRRNEESDPSTLTLWKKAVIRSGELQHRTMTDRQRVHDERAHMLPSNTKDDSGHLSRTRNPNRDKRETRTKHRTDKEKQIRKDELKRNNEMSQMSSDKFPPQPNTRSVVYFQNRFIILDSADRNTGSNNSTINVDKQHNDSLHISSSKMNSMETSFSKINTSTDSRIKTNRNIEMDASSVTMQDARGIDIILTDPDNSSKQIKNMDSFNAEEAKKRKTIWRKIHGVLLDDRVKASNGQIILENRHPEEYRILKKVLNILFLTIGITLFVSVIIVVIYAFIVGDDKKPDTLLNKQETTTKGYS